MYAEWLPSKANTPTPPHGVATSPPKALGEHQEPLRVPARYKLERPAQNWFDAEGWLSELSELSDTIGGLSEDYRRTIEGLSDVHYLDYRTLSGW